MSLTDRLNLPDEVRERLAAHDIDLDVVSVRVKNRLEEGRIHSAPIEFRANDDGSIDLQGYAATWGIPYDVAGGPPYGWTEVVEEGAVDRALREAPDIRLLVNHDSMSAFGLPIARTLTGDLTVASDTIGLLTGAAGLDQTRPLVQELRSALTPRGALGRAHVDQMSWAFRVDRQEWNEDQTERVIRSVSQIYDVSIVVYPANPATTVGLRSGELSPDEIADARDAWNRRNDGEPRGMSLDLARAYQAQLANR